MQPSTIEILVIGNEVLAGNVVDTNSHWLCGQLSARGARVRRITVLPDEPAAIGDGMLGALNRKPNLIITCGGLGPTADDFSVVAIAGALLLPLEENSTAYAMILDFYARLRAEGGVNTAEMLPVRAKMAQLPRGARPLANNVGASPGILLKHDRSTIVCLPGVPGEMKVIFANSLAPHLEMLSTPLSYAERTIRTDAWDESIMAPAVDGVAARHPQVYVKSRAQEYGGGMPDFVTLAARGREEQDVIRLLDAAEQDLRASLHALGIKTE